MSSPEAAVPRPVEWKAPDGGVWVLETAHGNRIPPVPLRREFEGAFTEGFRRSFAPLGLPLSHMALRHVNGWPYTSVFLHDAPRKAGGPPPAIVLKILSRVHPGFRKRTKIAATAIAERRPERMADQWFAERGRWIERILTLQHRDLAALDDAGLAAHVREAAALAAEGLQRHFELATGSIPLGEWLNHATRWGLDPGAARSAVMHGTPVHDDARRRLRRIADALGDTTPANLDAVRAHSDETAAALDDYLDHHGWWATEDVVDVPTVIDLPHVVLGAILAQRRGQPAADAAPEEILGALRTLVPAAEASTFDRLAADAQRSHAMLDDNSGILASWTSGLLGHVLRASARRLVEHGRLTDADHIWALEIDEIVALLDGTSALSADDAAARHADWQERGRLSPPRSLNGTPSPPPDPSVFPAPVAQLVGAVGAFLDDKFNYAGQALGIGERTVTGRAVVVADAADALERIEPGDILVTVCTTPAYNSILPIVAGIVVSEGGLSCHTAVVARELGLSALVGYAPALTTIPDGALVELDPKHVSVRVVAGAS